MHMYRVLVMSDINFTITIVALKNILIVNNSEYYPDIYS